MTIEKCQEDLVRSELKQHVDAVRAAVGRAVGGMLDTGRELVKLRAACRHGEWAGAVAAAGVPERTAQRLMRAWREYEERGALANPPSVTALLEAAREVKPDSVSDLAGVLDPRPIFEAFEICDDILTKNSMSDCGLYFCVWFVKGDGINQWMRVHFSVRSYADALQTAIKSVGQENHPELCKDANTLHQSTVLILNQYIDQARALVLKDERLGATGRA